MLELAVARHAVRPLSGPDRGAAREDSLARRVAACLRGRRRRARARAGAARARRPRDAARGADPARQEPQRARGAARGGARCDLPRARLRGGREADRRMRSERHMEYARHALGRLQDGAAGGARADRGKQVVYTVRRDGRPGRTTARFTCAATVDGEQRGVGSGSTKKEAEQEAALAGARVARGRGSGGVEQARPRRLVSVAPCVHLKSVRMRGFKSFPDQVEVRLEPGVAVVVGPNGSGKSNIADAIVWASGIAGAERAAGGEAGRRAVRRRRRTRARRSSARSSCSSTTPTRPCRDCDFSEVVDRRAGCTAAARASTSSTARRCAGSTSSSCSRTRASGRAPARSSARARSRRS